MRWTQEELDDYMLHHSVSSKKRKDNESDTGPESAISGKITKYCKDHGYPCMCFRQSKRAKGFLVPGWPD